ncbi:VOC family protein [Parafrankia sp. FMc6]|uniref:VOC family protein n=1 Tax=Parafrankia soli TaxID=2599596 RepID=UPI0034D7355B
MIDPNLDHVGLVVPELEPAMAALSTQLGLEWMGIFEPTLVMRDDEHGTRDVQLRIAVTAQYPRLELIQTIPDSPWALVESGMLLHHLAYYTGDLAADSGRLAGPCPIEIHGVGADGKTPKRFTYHLHNGLRFELLDQRSGRAE